MYMSLILQKEEKVPFERSNEAFDVREKHEGGDDVIKLSFDLNQNQYGIFGYEYKRPDVNKEGCKTADILACLVDDEKKEICSLIMDLKSNITCFDDDMTKNNSPIIAVKNVSDFVQQLHDEKLHKDSFLLYYKDKDYSEIEFFGIATRKFEPHKFLRVAEFMDGIMEDDSEDVIDLIKCKIKTSLLPYYGEVSKIRDFAEKRVCISGKYYELQIVSLLSGEGDDYIADVTLTTDLSVDY